MTAIGIRALTAILTEIKPVAALAISALMGALVVVSAVTMLGSAASPAATASASAPDLLVGISRFHTTDIRVAP